MEYHSNKHHCTPKLGFQSVFHFRPSGYPWSGISTSGSVISYIDLIVRVLGLKWSTSYIY